MGINIQIELIHNATLLIAMTTIFLVFQSDIRIKKFHNKLIAGGLTGLLGIIIMISAVHIEGAAIFDTRSVLLFTSGLFLGPIPTLIAAGIMVVCRMILGDAGIVAGILGILTTAGLGLLMRKFWLKKILADGKKFNFEFYLAGIIVHIDVLLCFLTIQQSNRAAIINQIALPALFVYPIATFLLCTLLKNQLVNNQMQNRIQEEKERYDRIIDAVNVGTWQLNWQTKEIQVNERWATMLGYSHEDFCSFHFDFLKTLINPEDIDKIEEQISALIEGKSRRFLIEFRMRHKNGNWIWIECKGGIDPSASNHANMIYGTNLDITARKQSQVLLQQSEERFKTLFDRAPIGYQALDEAGYFIGVNQQWLNLLGYTKEEVLGKYFADFLTPEYKDKFEKRFLTFKEKGEIHNEFQMIHKDGHKVFISFDGKIGYNDDGSFKQTHCALNDITEQKKWQEQLLETEERYRIITEVSMDGYFVVQKNGKILDCNNSLCVISGYTKEQLLNMHIFDFIPPELHGESITRMDQAIKIGYGRFASKLVRQDGVVLEVQLNIVYSENEDCFLGFVGDINERERTRKALEDSERRLIRAQHLAHIGDWELDLSSKKIWASEEAFEIYGVERIEPYLPLDLVQSCVDPQYRLLLDKTLASLIAKEGDYNVEFGIKKVNSQEERMIRSLAFLREDDEGNPQAVVGTIQDITKQKLQEKEILESEKKFRKAVEEAPIPIMLHAEDGEILAVSRTWSDLSGYQLAEIPSLKIWTQKVCGEKAAEIQKRIQKTSTKDERQHEGESLITTKMGTSLCWDFYSAYIGKLRDGRRITMRVAMDVSQQKERQQELLYISYHDQLTGVYNRRFYEEELARLEATRNLPLTIVMCDVNGLKLVNDSFGHAVGDQLLIKSAKAIQSCCRTDDLVARHGGDEFAIILPNATGDEAEQIIKRIRRVVEKEKVGSLSISISFGHETKTSKEQELKEILKSAEDHMYRHKLYESGSARNKTVELIINTLYEKNHREMLHSKRVSALCGQIATAAGMSKDDVKQVRIAGLMHDIGKIGIDDNILNKVEKLTKSEWEEIKKHSEIGYRILISVNEFSEIADFVLQHQEKWDGTGYPKGLKGEQISVEARIISIADSYDAMTGARPYQDKIPKADAIEELKRCAGKQFDPVLTNIFIEKVLMKGN